MKGKPETKLTSKGIKCRTPPLSGRGWSDLHFAQKAHGEVCCKSTTPFIIGSEVDVSCVLVLIQPAPWSKNKTRNTTSEPMIIGVFDC